MTDRDDAGFTLIELLVVMIVIGILAAIAVPVYLHQRISAYDARAKSDLRGLATQEELHLTNAGSYGTIADLKAANDDVLVSKGVTMSVVRYVGSSGFCLSAKHIDSDHTWFYDNNNFGIQRLDVGGCGVTNTGGLSGDSLSG